MTLGEYINQYLIEHDMSMRKFAALAGVSHSYISNIVNERTARGDNPAPTMKTYKGIAKAMGMDVNELIYRVETGDVAWGKQKVPTTPKGSEREEEYEEFFDLFRELTPENAELLIAQAEVLLKHQKSQDAH